MKVIDKRKGHIKESIYSIGHCFLCSDGELYMLSQVGRGLVCLVCLHDGNRYLNEPTEIPNPKLITQDELNQMHDQKLTRVNVEIHITSNAE